MSILAGSYRNTEVQLRDNSAWTVEALTYVLFFDTDLKTSRKVIYYVVLRMAFRFQLFQLYPDILF